MNNNAKDTKTFNIGHITVTFQGYDADKITEDMANEAVKYAEEHKDIKIAVIDSIIVTKENNEANFTVMYKDEDQPKISRIRRITGYLTGTTDRWNNAKRAELKDRVCHCG